MKNKTKKILIAGLIFVCIAIIAIAYVYYKQSIKVHNTHTLVSHTNDVLYQSQKILATAIDNETGARGYALTGSATFVQPLKTSENAIYNELNILKTLTLHHTQLQKTIDSLGYFIAKRIEFSKKQIEVRQQKGLAAVAILIKSGEGKFYTDNIRTLINKIQTEENIVLKQTIKANNLAISKLNTIFIIVSTLLFALIIIVFVIVAQSLKSQQKAEAQLQQLNKELNENVQIKNNQLTNIFERITDAFVAVDKNWRYTYVNEKAGEILNKNPNDLLGENIWEKFPEAVNGTFYNAYYTAVALQQYVHVEEYYPPLQVWLENHVYPSSEGISIFFRDVTKQKKAAAEIKERATQLQILSDNLPDTMMYQLVRKPNGEKNFTYIGKAIEKISTHTPDEILNNPSILYNLIHEDDRQKLITAEEESLKKMCEFNVEVRTRNYAGEIRWLNIRSVPRKQADESIIWDGIHTDITERKKAEEEIKKVSERFNTIALATNDAVWELDLLTKEAWYNENFLALFKKDRAGVNETPTQELWESKLHPDDKQRVIQMHEKTLNSTASTWTHEFRFLKPSGSYGVFYNRGFVVRDKTGNPIKTLGSIIEITDLKKAEEKIALEKTLSDSLINSMPGIVYLFDKNRKFLRWNKNFEILTGYSAEEISKMQPLDFYDKDEQEKVKLRIESVFIENQKSIELNLFTKEKNKIPVVINSMAIEYEGKPCLLGIGIDITEFKKATQLIKESEEKYRTLIDQASDAIFLYNWQGKFVEVNSSAEKLTGYTKEELLSLSIFDLIEPNSLKEIPVNYSALLKGEIIFAERNYLKKDGTIFQAEVSSNLLSNGYFHAIVRDVTERKKATQLIQESEEKYRTLIEQASDAIFVCSLEGQFTEVNSSAEKLCGYSRNELIQLNVLNLLHPDDAESIPIEIEQLKEGKTVITQKRYVKKDGTIIYVEVSSKLLANGYLQGIGRDITERNKTAQLVKESEEKYRTLIEQASDAIILYTKQGQFIQVNASAEKLCGYSKQDLEKITVFDLIVPDSLIDNPLKFEEVLKGNTVVTERKFIKKDRTIIDVEVSSKLLSNGYFQGIARDITQRKKAEKKLQDYNSRFEMITRATNDALWEWNFDTGEMWANERHQQLYGLTLADAVPPEAVWRANIHPLDRDVTIEIQSKSLQSNKTVFFSEYRFKVANEEYRYIYDRCYILRNEEGKPLRMVGSMMDITEKKIAEEQIKKEKNLSDSIINSLPGIFYLYDEDRKFLRWNKNFETVSGYSAAEIITMQPLDFFDVGEKEILTNRIAEVFKTGQAEVAANFFTKKKEKIPYYFTGIASVFEDKKCLIGVGIDITALNEAENKIVESEKRFRNTLDQTLEGVQIIGFDWKYIYLNEAALKHGHYTKQELIGYTMMEKYPGIEQTEMFTILKHCMSNRTPQLLTNNFIYPDKTSAWFELSIQPVPEGIFILSIDITERKKAEEEKEFERKDKEALINTTTDLIWSVDKELKLIAANKAFISSILIATGITLQPGDDMLKEDVFSLEQLSFWKVLYQKALSGESFTEEIFVPEIKDRAAEWLEINFNPVYTDADISGLACYARNITQRKEIEEEIRYSEEKRRLIMNAALDAIVCINTKGIITFWNPQAEKVFGWPEHEVMGKLLSSIIIPEAFRKMHDNGIENYLKTGKGPALNVMLELSAINRNGKEFPIELTVLSIKQGPDDFFCAFIRDITDRKNTQEAIKKSEEQYRYLFNYSPMPKWIYDIETFKILEVNEAAIQHYGYSQTEFLNKTIKDIRPQEDLEAFLNIPRHPNRSGTFYFGEWRHKKANNEIINVEISGHPIEYNGKKAMMIISQDITDRKIAGEKLARSEKIYKAIASGIPGTVIYLFDTNLRFLLIEGDMLKKLGYSKDALLGCKMQDVIKPEWYAQTLPNLKRVLKGETFTTESKRGIYNVVNRYVPLKDENNKVYGGMAVGIDVTDLKNAERQIIDLNHGLEEKIIERTKELEVANKELESFSYSVSHDLRAPLRAISGYSNILAEDYNDKMDAEGKRILKAIATNSKHMGQLIDDLLNFSRLGRKEISLQNVNMNTIVKSCIKELLSGSIANKFTLHIDKLPNAAADPAMMRPVWTNLIDNAIKYSIKKEKPIITIGHKEDDLNNIYFISDNGAGFDMHYADKLFGVFQRLHSQEEFEGTGVGLALVSRIIYKHGGTIWANAEVDKGAIFYFSLPKKNNL